MKGGSGYRSVTRAGGRRGNRYGAMHPSRPLNTFPLTQYDEMVPQGRRDRGDSIDFAGNKRELYT